MSNVIDFLENIGTRSELHGLSNEKFQCLVNQFDMEENQKKALANRDKTALTILLGVQANHCCLILEPQPEPEPEPDSNGLTLGS